MRCFLASSFLIALSFANAYADRKISAPALIELERGEQLFRDKDYAGAIAAFDAGYALDPQPIFLYDKAQAQRLAGDCAAAIATYNDFLATEPPANEAALARKNVENCEAIAGRALAPPPAAAPAAPSIEPEPATPPPLALSITEQHAWWSDRVGVTLATTGVIGLGVGAGFAFAARKAADETALATNVEQWSERRAAWQRDRIIAGVAAGAGVALVTLAAVRFSMRDRTVRVAATGGGGAVVAIGGSW
jgi:hypothetical protein